MKGKGAGANIVAKLLCPLVMRIDQQLGIHRGQCFSKAGVPEMLERRLVVWTRLSNTCIFCREDFIPKLLLLGC